MVVPERMTQRQEVRSALGAQFWEMPVSSARSLGDGAAQALPCEPPPLAPMAPQGAVRAQQLLAIQAGVGPLMPGYDGSNGGVVRFLSLMFFLVIFFHRFLFSFFPPSLKRHNCCFCCCWRRRREEPICLPKAASTTAAPAAAFIPSGRIADLPPPLSLTAARRCSFARCFCPLSFFWGGRRRRRLSRAKTLTLSFFFFKKQKQKKHRTPHFSSSTGPSPASAGGGGGPRRLVGRGCRGSGARTRGESRW